MSSITDWVVFTGSRSQPPSSQFRRVSRFLHHPLATRGVHLTSHDVSLVELDQPLDLSLVTAVCLAREEPTDVCVTAGWTADNGNKGFGFDQYLTSASSPSAVDL